jgi:hypothetical protein
MSKKIESLTPKENDQKLIGMAAKQLANLLWKQWLLKRSSQKSKSKEYKLLKSPANPEKDLN